jgi:hypothetical protein
MGRDDDGPPRVAVLGNSIPFGLVGPGPRV